MKKCSWPGRPKSKSAKRRRRMPRTCASGTKTQRQARRHCAEWKTGTSHLVIMIQRRRISTWSSRITSIKPCISRGAVCSSPKSSEPRMWTSSSTRRKRCSWLNWLTTRWIRRSMNWRKSSTDVTNRSSIALRSLKMTRLTCNTTLEKTRRFVRRRRSKKSSYRTRRLERKKTSKNLIKKSRKSRVTPRRKGKPSMAWSRTKSSCFSSPAKSIDCIGKLR